MRKIFSMSVCLLALVSCTTRQEYHTRYNFAQKIADNAHMQNMSFFTQDFEIKSFYRVGEIKSSRATLYIEGDGYAWLSYNRRSPNPSPRNPMGLRLAVLDNADNVFYLARPCQYTDLSLSSNCSAQYWAGSRFAPEVINSYLGILREIEGRYGIYQFDLVGYSGGGAVALLVAAYADNVKSVRTIAGNIAPDIHTEYHDVSSLNGSLKPLHYRDKLKAVPQIHYSGGQDVNVPPALSHHYAAQFLDQSCLSLKTNERATHADGWLSYWAHHSSDIPQCAE